MVFLVVMYGCECWTIKKTEHRRIAAFELWYWRRLLRVTWTARRSNQSILKEISPGCSLVGLMKLKLQYFGHLMWTAESFEKTLMLGKTEAGGEGDDRGWDGWMASPTGWTWVWVNSRSWWWTGKPGVLRFMGSQRVGHNWMTELNYTELYFIMPGLGMGEVLRCLFLQFPSDLFLPNFYSLFSPISSFEVKPSAITSCSSDLYLP